MTEVFKLLGVECLIDREDPFLHGLQRKNRNDATIEESQDSWLTVYFDQPTNDPKELGRKPRGKREPCAISLLIRSAPKIGRWLPEPIVGNISEERLRVIATGKKVTETKREINWHPIHPPQSFNREELLAAAAPRIQHAPEQANAENPFLRKRYHRNLPTSACAKYAHRLCGYRCRRSEPVTKATLLFSG
jgi:hypothetical protein